MVGVAYRGRELTGHTDSMVAFVNTHEETRRVTR